MTKKPPEDEERLSRYLDEWQSMTDPKRKALLTDQLGFMGVFDIPGELARRVA